MITLIRGIITKFSSKTGKTQSFSATGRSRESFEDRTAIQQFGFVSGLPEGTEAILLKQGQNVYLIASDNSKYRIAIEEGESAIYNQWGDCVVLGQGRIIAKSSMSVELGDETIDPTDGCVTGKCACAAYGVPHPVVSAKVKATMA